MSNGLTTQTFASKTLRTLSAGAVASFVTQPFEVMKTNMINESSGYMMELHKSIIRNGWSTYMQGGTVAVVRQAYGFALYTYLVSTMTNFVEKEYPSMNKFYNYSFSAVTSKYMAMMLESPLTTLKTRLQVMKPKPILEEVKVLWDNPYSELKRGLGSTLAREGVYSLFHYNTYRFLKDDIFNKTLHMDSTFIPAFTAGVVAITTSQPFEVIRSKVSLAKNRESFLECARMQYMMKGWRGFFIGYLPRLCRKPINSGISWSILESLTNHD